MSSTASCPAPGSGHACERVLLVADVVDSTALAARLDAAVLAAWWQAHDRAARALLRPWRGREIDRSDGFLLLFEAVADALGFAQAYHRALAVIEPPMRVRVGVHHGAVLLHENAAADVALGAKPLEVEGLAKSLAARLMALAQGGQTLLSGDAVAALRAAPEVAVLRRHGHWCLKGVEQPVEVFEAGDDEGAAPPPADTAKGWRVVRHQGLWLPAREIGHTLPAERDAFVGRQPALRTLARHIDDGVRLVSLLGPGGAGKTRLARRFGWACLGDFPGGVWFCDLSQAASLDGIAHAVSQGLELPLGRADAVHQIGQAIAGRGRCLVILDNFEQVAGHAEATLGRWLERAPEARFLVTTRELLGIAGEQVMALSPLPADEGVALFRERAQAAAGRFEPGADDEAALAPLVALLDGLPLAIELCAARVQVMPPRELLHRMGDRFRLLAGRAGRNDRHATLRHALDWSWELLSPHERSALAQLSVFEGGFTLEAAEAVIAFEPATEAPWVVDVLQSLVQKSLLRKVSDDRFGLLRTVQDYAAERLQAARSDGAVGAQARHWDWFAQLSERQAVHAGCIESENLVAACRRATAAGALAPAAATLVRAWSALRRVGPFGAALELARQVQAVAAGRPLEQATAAVVAAGALAQLGRRAEALHASETAIGLVAADSPLQAQLLCTQADLAAAEGGTDAAFAALQRACAIARAHALPLLECRALNSLGALHQGANRLGEADHCYRGALALAQQAGDADWEAALLGNLGGLLHSQGRLDEAQATYEQAIALAQQVGDRRWEGNTRCNLGWLHHEQGRGAEALAQLEAALAIARHLGSLALESTALCNLGIALQARGELALARERLEQAVELAARTGNRHAEGQYRAYLGSAYAALRLGAEATACFDAGEALLSAMDDPTSLGVLLGRRAMADDARGDAEAARRRWDEAAQLARRAGVSERSELGRLLAARVTRR